jgi:hypothetical protein
LRSFEVKFLAQPFDRFGIGKRAPGVDGAILRHGVIGPIEPDIAKCENFLRQPCVIGIRLRGKNVVIGLAAGAWRRFRSMAGATIFRF